ncbi:hypothetical protein BGX31_006287 [Mortierella sp. GBA43]|nr:hypothetical protein BGX31_006287 [Mortierella sp. GBA43]
MASRILLAILIAITMAIEAFASRRLPGDFFIIRHMSGGYLSLSKREQGAPVQVSERFTNEAIWGLYGTTGGGYHAIRIFDAPMYLSTNNPEGHHSGDAVISSASPYWWMMYPIRQPNYVAIKAIGMTSKGQFKSVVLAKTSNASIAKI